MGFSSLAAAQLTAFCLLTTSSVPAGGYDPLALEVGNQPHMLDLAVRDDSRERDIPLRVYLPEETAPAPVVLFSHGLGGTREGYAYLGRHWAARGYIAVFLQHPGSDAAVWKNQLPGKRTQGLKQAMTLQNWMLRVQDVPRVLDQLEAWNKQPGHPLAGRMDLSRVGMSGHSFGALTTQAVAGQRIPFGGQRFTDPRIRAAIPMSPNAPRQANPAAAFGLVKIPWLIMTGTKDIAAISNTDLPSRLAVYPALPATIDRYELVLHNAEHSAFSDRGLPGDKEKRNPNHHRAILALSTAFWDTHLRHDNAARAWLHGPGPRSVLEPHDKWQFQTGSTP